MGNRCCLSPGRAGAIGEEIAGEDPLRAAGSAAVLNRWRCVEVATLQAKFRSHANSRRLLDQQGFEEIFPSLKEYPSAVRHSIYRAFQQPHKHGIDFHDFCWTLSLCVHGTEAEMEQLLFALFTGAHNMSASSRTLSGAPDAAAARSDSKRLEMRAVAQLQHAPSTDSTPAEASNGHVLHLEDLAAEYKHADSAGVAEEKQGAAGAGAEEDAELVDDRRLTPVALQSLLRFCNVPKDSVEEVVAACPPGGMNYSQYLDIISAHLSDDMITVALRQFDLLPSAALERDLVQAALEELAKARRNAGAERVVEEGDTVYLLLSSWWRQWCSYVKVSPQYDLSNTYLVGLEWLDGNTTPTHRSRPNEIDNSALQSPTDPVNLRPGLRAGHDCDYVAVAPAVWQKLLELYGGGPGLARRVTHISDAESECIASDGAETTSFTVVVDPYPVVLKGYWCNRCGRPEAMAADLIVSSRSTILNLLNRGIREHGLQHALKPEDVRVWLLKFNLPEDTGSEKPEDTQPPAAQSGEQEPEPPHPQEASTNASTVESESPKPRKIRSGLTSWWVLLDEDERRLTLEELELSSGARIMFEIQNVEHQWPTDRLTEPPSFRSFKPDDRLDAMDYQGRWYTGSVVQVQQYSGIRSSMGMISSPGVYNFPASTDMGARQSHAVTSPGTGTGTATYTKVRVHFDKFSTRWDEWYDINSHKLAPLGCYTVDPASQPAIPELEKSKSEAGPEATASGGKPQDTPETTAASSTSGQDAPSQKQPGKGFSLNPARLFRSSHEPGCGGWLTAVGFGMMAQRVGDEDGDMPDRAGGGVNYYPLARRRAYNGARPNMLGACGLVNLGNTCFLNTALQCLSHTPLFRAYLLSNRFLLDVNRQNPLGTQGRIVEEYASLLRQLWSGESMYVVPSRFKRVLEKYKPQFVGHEQQDAQEFLAEMLDCLHEDVNRVLNKPYVPGLEDEEIERLTLQQHAEESWRRHLARNKSVLVDLFQGQLRNEVKCPACNKVSRTFDPFMFLSVPIPRQHEVVISVIFHPRMRTMTSVDSRVKSWMETLLQDVLSEDELDRLPAIAQEMLSDAIRPIKLALKLPKLSDVGELKVQAARLLNLRPEYLSVAEVYRHKFHRFLDDRQPVAYFGEHDTVHLFESTTNIRRIFAWTTKRLNSPDAGLGTKPRTDSGAGAADAEASADAGLKVPKEETDGYYSEDDDEVLLSKMKNGEGNIVADLDNTEELLGIPRSGSAAQTKKAGSVLKSFDDIRVGMRVDAADHRNQWFTGSVTEITPGTDDKRAEFWIHFDNFSNKWDEPYCEQDIKAKRILPAYTRASRKAKLLDFQVIHRRAYVSSVNQSVATTTTAGAAGAAMTSTATSAAVSAAAAATASTPKNTMEVFGNPMIVVCESYRTAEHLYRQIVLQALRCVDPEYRRKHNLIVSDLETATMEEFWLCQERLPFTVRMASTQNPYVTPCDEDAPNTVGPGRRWEGCPFPRSSLRPAANVQHRQLVVTIDWHTPAAYWKECEVPRLHKTFTRWQEQQARDGSAKSGVTLHDCLKAFTSEEELEDASWYCSKCKEHRKGIMKCALWRLPDMLVIHLKRFNCSARFREKIRTKVVFPLTSLDLSEYVSHVADDTQSNHRAGDNPADYVYDLYAVSNHLGGMAGGHYTAFVNCVPCRPDGVEEVAISSRDQSDGKWLHFDDEFVEEIPSDRVVSEAAYVLFYRKRRLTPSNIINMTV